MCRGCVSTLRYFAAFIGVLWYCCTVFRRTDVPIGRCTAFGHVRARLPNIWYVPVHLLPYHRGIDPSERSHRAAYCLQQRCLVRPRVVFTNSASHPSERWHRGCLAKPGIKTFNCMIAPICVRWHPSVRWHRGAQKKSRKIFSNPFAPGAILRMITVGSTYSVYIT